MDQQHLQDLALDVLQQRVRDRQLPHTAGGLGELPADVMAVQCIADGIQRPGGDPQIPHKGGELPIDNQVLSSLLMPAERYKFVWGTARRYLPAHRRCAPIPQAGSPARSAYARIQPTGRDSRPAPERGCSYHPCQQAWCELYQNYSRSPAAVKRRTAAAPSPSGTPPFRSPPGAQHPAAPLRAIGSVSTAPIALPATPYTTKIRLNTTASPSC